MMQQVVLLKTMALKFYSVDGGTMYECFDDEDYSDLIAENGSAELAWEAHMETLEAQRECGGYYERDTEEPQTEPEVDTRDESEKYGSSAHAAYGDAWLYRDCPEAY